MKRLFLALFFGLGMSFAHAQSAWDIKVKGEEVTFDGEQVLSIKSGKGGESFFVLNTNGDTLITLELRQFIHPELRNDPKNPRGIVRFFEYRFVPMGLIAEAEAPVAYNRKSVIMDLAGNDLIWPGGLDTANVRMFCERFGKKYSETRANLVQRYGRRAVTVPGTE